MDDLAGLEVKRGCAVGALGDILVCMFGSGVRQVGALAEIHNVHVEEVGQIKSRGNIRSDIVDQIVDVSFQIVDQCAE